MGNTNFKIEVVSTIKRTKILIYYIYINPRFQYHWEFLSQCIKSKLIPKGLKLELEQSIGNHDQEFSDMWYYNLQQFSRTLMKGIVKFCDKIISETAAHINSTEKALKQNMEQLEFQKIKETISINE